MDIELTPEERLKISQEDDRTTITIDGETIEVEQSSRARRIADSLWDGGNGSRAIGVALKNRGFTLRAIADAMDDGVTKSDGTIL